MNDRDLAMKNDCLLQLCIRWLLIKNQGKSAGDYFEKQGITEIAIYGCGDIGKRLVEELSQNTREIKIRVGMDLNADNVDFPIAVIRPCRENISQWGDIGTIVVSSVYFYNDIYNMLRACGFKGRILALNDVLLNI